MRAGHSLRLMLLLQLWAKGSWKRGKGRDTGSLGRGEGRELNSSSHRQGTQGPRPELQSLSGSQLSMAPPGDTRKCAEWCDVAVAPLVECVPSTLKALPWLDPQQLIKRIQQYMPVSPALGKSRQENEGVQGHPQLCSKLHVPGNTSLSLMQRGKIAVGPKKTQNTLSHSSVVPA